MRLRLIHIVVLCFVIQIACAQGIRDSVFTIRQVEITAGSIFRKEEAGMKETKVDSLVLSGKINLSLSELLSENTPVFIKSHGRGALATASFRGTAASHTQVNWNGININSPMAGMVDFSLIPVYIIDELNLKHGNASITDRAGGLGGTININNTTNWNHKTSIKYMQGIGSYKTFDEFLQFNCGNKKVHSKTRVYHNYSKNDYPFINRRIGNIDNKTGTITNPQSTNENAGYTRSGILQEVYYRPDHNNIVSVKYWGQWADRTIPRATSYEGPDHSNLNNQTDVDHKVVADWEHFADRSKLEFRTGYSDKKLDYVLKNNIPGLGLIPAIYSESNQRSFMNHLSYSYDFNSGLSIESSLDANLHDVISRDSVQKTGYEQQRFESSFFLAMHKNFADRLNINLMLRQDWLDHQLLLPVPYLGFDFRLIKGRKLFLKGNIARNYHHPSLNDLYWKPGGNPDLLPEEGMSYELGLEYMPEMENHMFQSELTVYRSGINNWIIWVPSYKGYWEPGNIKRVKSQGVELNIQLKGNIGMVSYKILGTYAYTSSVNYGDPLVWGDESFGKQLVYIPLHSGNVMVHLSYKGFFITYQHHSYSERYTTSSNDVTRRDWLYPYFMNELILGKEIHVKKLALSAEFKIYNLFNETYHSILYRPMPGRNYLLLFMIKF